MKTVGIVSLGCAKNRVNSEELLGLLRDKGYEIVQPEKAQIVFVNTCGFIEPAKEESIGEILDLAARKGKGLEKLYVTGCLVQRYPEALKEGFPEVDGFLGVNEYERVFEMMESDNRPMFCGEGKRFLDNERVITTTPGTAYVKISDGCDNRCTYCAIPLIRGKYGSRPMESIVRECEQLAAQGIKEITLIAQDTSRYGTDFGSRMLPELLRRVAAIEGLVWVRVLYCYPDTVDDELLDTIANTPKVVKYLDLPLQHINARLLKAMNRRGTPEHIRELVEKCRERDIVLRTTFIVGFPGETEDEFEELLDFAAEAQFDRMGAFAYSPEEGTVAAEMDDQIDEDIKAERLDEIMLMQQGIALEKNEERVGEETLVLCEGRKGKRYFGRSEKEAPESDGKILFESVKPVMPGDFVRVRITRAEPYDLYGEAIE
ncbi:MAG: 30S ribosomal protein S12 methylthiotransferase RimO [Clostridiales bacterium]|nr:30S ribosomal protein S12 methylthiotransferase RimO [Clostridiales bacterium]